MSDSTFSRRNFLQLTAAAAAMLGLGVEDGISIAAEPQVRKPRPIAPGAKIRMAQVGFAGFNSKGKGTSDINNCAESGMVEVVALCDIDWSLDGVQKMFEKYPNAKRYQDFRKMLLEMDDQIDAVGVATPDHMHFLVAYMAMSMGKHVYVQKPLTQTVWEADQLLKLARQTGVCTQMGNQGHAGDGCRLVREWVQAGLIGDVKEVHIWTNRPIWPQGMKQRPAETKAPEKLAWDLWLGRAPERPYAGEQPLEAGAKKPYGGTGAYHPFNWRGWRAFGAGALGDMGCHIMDASFWALDLDKVDPISIEAQTEGLTEEAFPKASTVIYKFPARGKMPPLTLYWYDGARKPKLRPELVPAKGLAIGGMILVGEKAAIYNSDDYCNIEAMQFLPAAKRAELKPREVKKTIPRVPGSNPHTEWLTAIQKGDPKGAGSNFEYSVPLTKMVVLGNLAVLTGKKIEWDGQKLECTNVPEANQYVKPVFRTGWSPEELTAATPAAAPAGKKARKGGKKGGKKGKKNAPQA